MIQFAATVSSAIVFWTVGIIFVSASVPKTGAQLMGRLGMLAGMAASGAAAMAFWSGAIEASIAMVLGGLVADAAALVWFNRAIGLRCHLIEVTTQARLLPASISTWWNHRLKLARRAAAEHRK